MSWRAGIIAAGHGERLRAGGWRGGKAMLPVDGRPLVDHALDRFARAGVERVSVLINADAADARDHLLARSSPPTVSVVVRTTPSSFASFALMAGLLDGDRSVVTTVDAIMPAADFAAFLDAAARRPARALTLGLTRHVDDEKPLRAMLADDGRIAALGGEQGTHVTAGLYAWAGRLPVAAEQGFARLRDYLGALVAGGHRVFGVDLPLVLDVDRPADVAAATLALRDWTRALERAA